MSLHRTAFGPEIQSAAEKYGLDPKLVEAIVIVESGGKTSAYRYEPAYFRTYCAKHPLYKDQNPLRVAASYGLGQVMFPTAVDMGFPKELEPEELFKPKVGLEYCARYLAFLFKKFGGDTERVLAAYNAGPGVKKVNGKYPNDLYVQKVFRHLKAA